MLAHYSKLLAERKYVADAAQQAAAQRLQRLYEDLLDFKAARRHLLRRFITPAELPRGVYFWGGVGRGKSFLMDCFYAALPYRRKRRIHFHAFMQEIHAELERHAGASDPLKQVATQIARQTRLLCFDEFHVSDIADAMILGRLFEVLFAQGVIMVLTSNYPPEQLWPNGLLRERFLPTIALLKAKLDIIEIDAGVDYRLRTLSEIEIYHYPADAASERKMSAYFADISGELSDDSRTLTGKRSIEVLGRKIPIRNQAHGVAWFDFAALCDGPRSQNDYLEIAHRFHSIMLSGVPRMAAEQSAMARRFTWLVDVLYDARVKLIITAACPAEELYSTGLQAAEFARTVSRLIEMRSRDYLALPHQ